MESGADLLELGIPFSDVMADGPVIQKACQRALERGTSLDDVFEMVSRFRQRDAETPIILMGYMNPLERRGIEAFSSQAAVAGVDGLLIVDCPADEAVETTRAFDADGLYQIFLIAPTTSDSRLERMVPLAGGFIYYVTLKGVTGSAALDASTLGPAVRRIHARSELPVAVGFGISTPEQAAQAASAADAVVIGSALVDRLHGCRDLSEALDTVREYIGGIRQALDRLAGESTAAAS
ncbi:MAG: tryptophan synthase subunit alpha [Xanthomonadaceae bacterium]|nr:tryptophan synthase subunit alpha [Xanthomonadaceae bacterium]